MKALCSHSDAVSQCGFWGGVDHGWAEVSERLDWVAAQASRGRMGGTAVALGLVIPVTAGLTRALPAPSEGLLGLLLGVAGGVLAYVSAAHLLPC